MPSASAPFRLGLREAHPHRRARSRELYAALLGECGAGRGSIDELARSASRSFLLECVADAANIASDFPTDVRCLAAWLDADRQRTGKAYRQYLDERQKGAGRRFFSCRSHALHFLRTVAPTKLVDGAWLYGMLGRWDDLRLAPLIRIYLEELGGGMAAQNHVAIYRRLLASNGCDGPTRLSDEHYVQGAIQLSLAHHAQEFLPEVIGFNLGYEQLPLHLPITAHELAELDIDPAYFSLHVTVDNASTGHARKALDALVDMLPKGGSGEQAEFMRRVALGYRLNDLGIGTVEAIESFDLERELVEVLAAKAEVGADLHSDRCRVGGRSVTAWLSDRREAPALLASLASNGWIRRGQDPEESRFWRLLHDERAPMFGVFSGFEDQLLRDWIAAGDTACNDASTRAAPHTAATGSSQRAVAGPALRRHLAYLQTRDEGPPADDADCRALEAELLEASSKTELMALLHGHLSPANHHKPAGLLATRLYAGILDGRL